RREPPPNGDILAFDGQDETGDSISRVFTGNVDSCCGTVDSNGLITLFGIRGVPRLFLEQKTNALVMSWAESFPEYDLQSTPDLRNWQTITTNITRSPVLFTAFYTLPLDSITNAQFFRLKSQ